MNKYLIKKATMDDIDFVLSLTKKCFSHYQHKIGMDTTLDALGEKRSDVEKDILNSCVYICLLEDKIVGSARVHSKGDNLLLTRFGVDPLMQSVGIGGLIVDRIVDDFKGTEFTSISLHTALSLKSSIGFYKKHGFDIVSVSSDRGYERAQLMRYLK